VHCILGRKEAPLATSPGCRKGELCMDDDADEHASFPSGSPSHRRLCGYMVNAGACVLCLFLPRRRDVAGNSEHGRREGSRFALRVEAYVYLTKIARNRSWSYICESCRVSCSPRYISRAMMRVCYTRCRRCKQEPGSHVVIVASIGRVTVPRSTSAVNIRNS
jgi:hypothetical protein